MVKDDGLATHTDGHLLCHMDETPHESLPYLFHVMVSQYEVDMAIQSAEYIVPLLGAAECEVPEVEHDSVRRNGLVPPSDQFVIHL